MTGARIPDDLKMFLMQNVGTSRQLEVLLAVSLMPGEGWTLAAVSRRTNLPEAVVINRLLALCMKGLIVAVEGNERLFFYSPQNKAIIRYVEHLRAVHAQTPEVLTELLL